jgi:hypothetical protein
MPKPTDREADYMCFSPLRGKTSELEGEEEYNSRLVSRNLQRTINEEDSPTLNLPIWPLDGALDKGRRFGGAKAKHHEI